MFGVGGKEGMVVRVIAAVVVDGVGGVVRELAIGAAVVDEQNKAIVGVVQKLSRGFFVDTDFEVAQIEQRVVVVPQEGRVVSVVVKTAFDPLGRSVVKNGLLQRGCRFVVRTVSQKVVDAPR